MKTNLRINICHFIKSKNYDFPDYLNRLINLELGPFYLNLKYEDEYIISGKCLYEIYDGYKRGEVVIPKKWEIYKVTIGPQDRFYQRHESSLENESILDRKVKIINFSKGRKNTYYYDAKIKGHSLKSIVYFQCFAHYKLSYGVKSKKLYKSKNFESFEVSKQITLHGHKATSLKFLKFQNSDLLKIGYLNHGLELKIFSIIKF